MIILQKKNPDIHKLNPKTTIRCSPIRNELLITVIYNIYILYIYINVYTCIYIYTHVHVSDHFIQSIDRPCIQEHNTYIYTCTCTCMYQCFQAHITMQCLELHIHCMCCFL